MDYGTTKLIQILMGRATFYEFFSIFFKKPIENEEIEFINQFAPYFEMLTYDTKIEEIENGLKKLAEALEDDHMAEKLAQAYLPLFADRRSRIYPFESNYLADEPSKKRAVYEDILAIYSFNDFTTPYEFKGAEDHISMEMLFMAKIIERGAKYLEELDEENSLALLKIQKDFLESHLLKWLPLFSRDVIRKSMGKSAYDAIALLLAGYLKYDLDLVSEIINKE